jgi:hypothetical protein
VLLRDRVCVRDMCINTVHKGDSDDNYDDNNNNNVSFRGDIGINMAVISQGVSRFIPRADISSVITLIPESSF